jgi:hypothetical protein
MAYKLEVDHPDFPKGWEFDLDGILVENGSSVSVDEDMERSFLSRIGRPIKDIYGHSEIVKLTGSSALSPKEKAEALAGGATAPMAESEGGES